MSSPFGQPSSGGDKFEPGDFNGALLLFYPKSYNPNETTKFGPSTSADVDVIVVDRQDPATGKPVIKFNARVFGNLANSVRDSIGSVVLGRLGQGVNTKGKPPWILLAYTDADQALAMPVHEAYKAGQFKQPEAPAQQAPPSPDPWAGMQTTTATPAPAIPAVAPAASAAPSDPNIMLLISKGLDAGQVVAMDPGTRAAVAATFA